MLPLGLHSLWLAGGTAGAALSLWPGGAPLPFAVWDKAQHVTGYFLLTVWFTGICGRDRYLMIGVACFAFRVAIEGLRALTATRSAELADTLANGVGIVIALAASYLGAGGWASRAERLLGVARG